MSQVVTGFIFLEECARYLYLLEVNINIRDGGMNEGEADHLSFLNGGLVFVQFYSLVSWTSCMQELFLISGKLCQLQIWLPRLIFW